MMKKLLPILLAFLASLGVYAQAPSPFPILVDSQRDTVAGLQVFQANAITFRASYRSGGATNNLVAVTPFMYWQPYGATNATVVTGRWSIVSAPAGTVDFSFTPADLNFATGTYTYQIGLNVSGGPNVIKQGAFVIKASQASIGASPIVFGSTNVNWGSINWTGLPAYEYQTNTIAVSNALNSQIVNVSNALNTAIVNASNSLNARVTANETGKVSKVGDTMSGNLGFTNAGLTSLDFVTFDTAPTGAISQARMQWQSGRQTLRLGLNANVNLDVGQQVILYARNEETNTLSKGEVVFVAGANGDNPTIKRASNASEALSARTIGITAEDITVNASGHVVTKGTVYGLNTTNFTQGANLYLGANGTVQTNLPTAPSHGVFVGVVERVHPNAGQIYVAIQNYQELRELSDVFLNGLANNDLLAYNSASNRWQNTTLTALGITSGLLTNEADPIFVAASNSFYPRSNPSNFLTTATLSGYATGTPLYVETDPTALTNVTASGRITATKTGKQVALTFDASGLATGTPIYSVAGLATGTPIYSVAGLATGTPIYSVAGLATGTPIYSVAGLATGTPIYSVAGLATGTPLYTFTETDTIATNRLTNYYTITSADAKFATGTPLYVEALFNANSNRITLLEAYTNRAASALSSSVWASADSTTNYASRVAFNSFTSTYATADSTTNYALRTTFNSATNFLNNKFTNYLPLAGGTMANHIFMNGFSLYDVSVVGSGTSGTNIDFDAAGFNGSWTFNSQPVIAGYQTTTGAVNAANLTNTAVLGFASTNTTASLSTNVAARLASNVWAIADSTTNYASRVTFGSFTSSYATADATTNYASRITFNETSNSFNSRISIVVTGAVYVTNLSAIAGSGLGVTSNQLVVTNVASTFEALTGSRFSLGNSSVTNISNTATGAFVAARVVGTNSIGNDAYGASQLGYITRTASIGSGAAGASQQGVFSGTASIGIGSDGASQQGVFSGTASIGNGAEGASQQGWISGAASIGASTYGAIQIGYLHAASTATNNGVGAIQLMGGVTGEVYTTTSTGRGSLLLGPGTQTNAYGILANGPIQSLAGFVGNAALLTNFPSSLLTVSQGNTNYWRISTAPTNATESGQRGQIAVSSSNVFIYSPDAAGTGTGRWIRISGSIDWP